MHMLHDVRVAWSTCCMMHVLPRVVLSISFWEQCSHAPPLFPPLGTELSARRGPNWVKWGQIGPNSVWQGQIGQTRQIVVKWGCTGPTGVKWCQRRPNQAIRDHMKPREDQWGQRRALYSRVHILWAYFIRGALLYCYCSHDFIL